MDRNFGPEFEMDLSHLLDQAVCAYLANHDPEIMPRRFHISYDFTVDIKDKGANCASEIGINVQN